MGPGHTPRSIEGGVSVRGELASKNPSTRAVDEAAHEKRDSVNSSVEVLSGVGCCIRVANLESEQLPVLVSVHRLP